MKKICLSIALVAIAAANAANTYNKVTIAPSDWAGTYLIVCENQSVVFKGSADTASIDAKGGLAILTEGFTISEGVLTSSQAVDSATFSIGKTDDESWPWYIQSASGLYIGHKDEDDNGLSTEFELKNKCKHTLSVDANGNFIAVARYSTYGPYNLQYNKKTDQMRFRYFEANDKVAIQIYKLNNVPSGLAETALANSKAYKVIRNGRLLIIKDGKEYSVLGN